MHQGLQSGEKYDAKPRASAIWLKRLGSPAIWEALVTMTNCDSTMTDDLP